MHRGAGPDAPQALRFSRGFLQPEEVITCDPVFQGTFNLSGRRVDVRRHLWPLGCPERMLAHRHDSARTTAHVGLPFPRSGSGTGARGPQPLPPALQDSQIRSQGWGQEGQRQAGQSPACQAEGWAVPEGQCVGPEPRGRAGHAMPQATPQQVGDMRRVPSPWPSGVRSAGERKRIPNSLRFQLAKKNKVSLGLLKGDRKVWVTQGPEHRQTWQAAGWAASEWPPQDPWLPRRPPKSFRGQQGGSRPVPTWAAGQPS